jgi:hypothetical protein
LIIVLFIVTQKKVTHKIKFEGIDELYVSTKSPLFITTNESADYDNLYPIPAHSYESLRGCDLAKLETTWSFIPLPIFYNKLKITPLFDDDSGIEMDSSVDNPIEPQDDISLSFNSGIGESLVVTFDYYIKSPSIVNDDDDFINDSKDIIGFGGEENYDDD